MSLTLRPYQPSDAAVITSWLKSEYLMRQWCADRYERYPVTPEDMNIYYERNIDGQQSRALTMTDGDDIVGYITLRTPADNLAEQRLGFVIVDDSKRGHGLGKALVSLAVKYAFEELGATKVSLGVFENNPSAIHCYESAGFHRVSLSETESYECLGETWNCIEMEQYNMDKKIYPRSNDNQTVYLKSVVTRPTIEVGDFTIYNDFVNNPRDFEKNNVLYHYPINNDRLIIGKFCSIACGAKFIFNCANHTLKSLSTYTFPLFFEEWNLPKSEVASAWDNKGDIVIGNDVWIGYDAVIMAGVTIGDGAIIGTRAVVSKDVEPYSIVGGVPAKEIRKRFAPDVIKRLLELQWWNWPDEKIHRAIPLIRIGKIELLEKLL
ncbi:GNAT family N-acetyltransferase [Muribaculaceae bacterium Isolate-004 (NCI)]|jgi:virginiamycin A acetyltransferase|nr:2,3,4,5-tetrahydropyridine-2,6-dicarboxylate N-acetyltransferase [uncultured bacterium]QTC34793.1 2,3,4,5-tetrahydropyridine-2,6-dicarboxylate N-acetyltransferase [uncultured bacterium]QTC35015.1 2,3,4,5-tetrahydropyridine-2,6-dicarboxylate N-acetyltransferase [uncultured bacterium]RXE60960.1 GNAT family N-acetyltransferase [Muribaculaceae bacterium Isolate-004 (NCI)]RXE67572.1 GNAT family N-acetyltransferase [Muribaculaceae bacterium Isolate-001 (NCI)]